MARFQPEASESLKLAQKRRTEKSGKTSTVTSSSVPPSTHTPTRALSPVVAHFSSLESSPAQDNQGIVDKIKRVTSGVTSG